MLDKSTQLLIQLIVLGRAFLTDLINFVASTFPSNFNVGIVVPLRVTSIDFLDTKYIEILPD